MFMTPKQVRNLSTTPIGIARLQPYKAALIANGVTCFLAAAVTILRAALVHWLGDSFGIVPLQQSMLGLAIASVAVTSAILYGLIVKGENKNGSGKSQ